MLARWWFLFVLGAGLCAPLPSAAQDGFGPPVVLVDSLDITDFVLFDLDGDDDLDLAFLVSVPQGENAALYLSRNDGAGSFDTPRLQFDLPGGFILLEAGDLNGDGTPDLVAGAKYSRWEKDGLGWIPNVGGTLSRYEEIDAVDGGPVVLTDFDGDGDLDILRGGRYLGYYENRSDRPARFLRRGALLDGRIGSFVAADFDSGDFPELALGFRTWLASADVILYAPRALGIDPRLSTSTTLPLLLPPPGPFEGLTLDLQLSDVAAVDLDQDGRLDVVATSYQGGESGHLGDAPLSRVSWYRNGTGPLGRSVEFSWVRVIESDRVQPGTIAHGDFDRDGDPDLAVPFEDEVVWYENEALAQAFLPRTAASGLDLVDLVSADLDRDGLLDLVGLRGWVNRAIVWIPNNGATPTSTSEDRRPEPPPVSGLRLEDAHPNPSAGSVQVTYALPLGQSGRLQVVDALGRRVEPPRTVRGTGQAADLLLDLSRLPSGTYTLRLEADGKTATTQIVRIN